jgi:methionyl-tRNA formyltransferase
MDISELFDKLSIVAGNLTIQTLKNYNNISPKRQNKSKVSYCKKIIKNDGKIDFIDSKIFYQKYKAFKYWPGIFLKSKLKIKECKIIDDNLINNSGKIIEIRKRSLIVSCKKGLIEIITVQPPSKKEMNIVDYCRGARLEVGNILS